MSEHSHFARDRLPAHDRGDRTYAEYPNYRTRENADNDDQYLSDDEVWHRRYSDEHPAALEEIDAQQENEGAFALNHSDFDDVQYPAHRNWIKLLTGCGVVLAMFSLVGFLALAYMSALSPDNSILNSETHSNIGGLSDCTTGVECSEDFRTKDPATTDLQTTKQSRTVTAANSTSADSITSTRISGTDNSERTLDLPTDRLDTELTEIAATAISESVNNIPTDSTPNTADTETQSNTTFRVLQQWSNVRGTPAVNGTILIALAAGKTVTKIGQSGNWIEVVVNEQPSITGYMHNSTVITE